MIDIVKNTNERRRGRRVLIYGVHGVGKSTFANCAPKPVFIQTEDGLGDIDAKAFPLCVNADQVEEYLKTLATEEHDFETLCIDSLDWFERLIWDKTAREHDKQSIEDFGYQKGYTLCLDHWRSSLEALSYLSSEKGMNVILVAHSKTERYSNPETEPYDRYVPRLHKNASALVQEWCDEVLFASFKVVTKKDGEGFRQTSRGISTGERTIKTTEKPSAQAKNRLGMPDEIPLAFSSYWEYVTGEVMSEPMQELNDTF